MYYEQRSVIKHLKGLHTRAAAMAVQKAHELNYLYQAGLFFKYKQRDKVVATSLLLLCNLKIKVGDELWVGGSGEKAELAVKEMVDFLESDFLLDNPQIIGEVDQLLEDSAFTAEQVFNSMANGLIVSNEENIITVFNPAAEKILGISANTVVEKKACDCMLNFRLHVINQTGIAELACRQVVGDSVIIANCTPVIIDGQVKGAVAIFEDISAMEKITWELQGVKELKERLQLILESVQDGICVLNQEGDIIYANLAYLGIVSQKYEELVGKNIQTISPHGARYTVLRSGKQIWGSVSQKASGVTVVANITPIIVDGELRGAVSVVKNSSEVHDLMEKLNHVSAKAEYLEEELWRTKRTNRAFEQLIGRSGKIMDVLAMANKAAQGVSNVLIQGESGTGKELVAEGIHYASPWAQGPFIRVNCGAIPANLLESELFGHEKGSFTGAIRRKLGKFELANNGTIFLDEIGEMEKTMQVKILRILQKREFERVGGETTIKVNVRIIAATNQNLETMVAQAKFREDLYYRLNVIPLLLPALRERKEDIPLLAEYFLNNISCELGQKIKSIRRDALDVLINYRWPGNVRELQNIIERVVTFTEGLYIDTEHLPSYIREEVSGCKREKFRDFDHDMILSWEEYEKKIIQQALKKYGSFNQAGKILGLTHKTVAAKARKYGIEKTVTW